MFSIIFPGQGSQAVGMAKELFENYSYVKEYFFKADDLLKRKLSKLVLEGPKDELDQTENTQPAIFLVSFSIFKIIQNETDFKISDAKYFAGHSLGEYSALCCAESLTFEQTLILLRERGSAMQNAVPKGEGGMVAILGEDIELVEEILNENNQLKCYVANDNSIGQVVISGKLNLLNTLCNKLKEKKIKYVKLPVSAPFHSPLMRKATIEMRPKILETKFKDPKVSIISNVLASPQNKSDNIKNLLIEQIEKPVRWRESVVNMLNSGVDRFIEIGPGKILSGLIKRIDRNVKLNQINNLLDIKNLTND